MKIIIVSPSLDPKQNVSGISAITQFIIDKNKNVEYIHFNLGKKDNEKRGILRFFSLIISMFNWIILLKKNPDAIIHYNFPLSTFSIIRDSIFISYVKILNRKIIIHIHGGIFLTATHTPYLLNIILKRIFSLNVPFIVLSKKEENIIKEKYRCKKVFVLPNCIDLDDSSKFNRKNNSTNNLVLGYIGRIVETKGIDFLLNACIELKKRNIQFTLKLAGKEDTVNKYIPKFSNELKDSFIYEGVISGEAKNKFFKEIDIFILPSFFEGLPMSLIECMSYGVVPVTTNVGSIGEIITNNYNGIYINLKDSDSIVNQVIRLNDDRNLLHELSLNSRKYIIDNFSASTYINTLNQIYDL